MNQCIYAVAGIFDALVIIILFDGVMQRRKYTGVVFAIYSILALNCIGAYLLEQYEKNGYLLPWSVILLFFLSLFYEETMIRRVLYVILSQLFAMIAETVTIAFAGLFDFSNNPDAKSVETIELIFSKLVLFIFVMGILVLKKKEKTILKKHLMYFMIVPFISMIIVHGLLDKSSIAWGIALMGILMINLIVYYILNLMAEYTSKIYQQEMLRKQVEKQRENYDNLTEAFQMGNQMLHDVNKHFRQIEMFLEQEDVQQAKKYLYQVEGNLEKSYGVVKTGNMVVDSISSHLKAQLEKIGNDLELDLHIDSKKIVIDDYDFVVILGNIAENVINEMKESKNEKVYWRVETAEEGIIVNVVNPVHKNKKEDSEKKRWFHGLGLNNISETVKKYEGMAQFEKQEECFETMIMIPYEKEINV